MLRTGARIAAAVLLTAAAYAATPVAAASAAGCSTADGVTVVVDFHELGGGVQTGCVSDGAGDTAASLFPAAGFSLSFVQRQPGFVCRVDGAPADDPCVNTPPADAYWALYWSDGKSGSWTYATSGVGGLRVPDGGYVALSWQGSAARSAPGLTPSPHASATPSSTPTRTPAPSAQPSQHASTAPSTAAGAPSESPTASPSAAGEKKPRGEKSRTPKPIASETPSAAPTAETSADAVPTAAEPGDPDDGGLPAWVAPAVIAALFAGAGAAAVVRRRRGVPGA
ncbi:hypothetical protein [Nocardioides caricicola]|uniref:Uncharacterized protein n=1 Tax=Nocardioides caricicola TaxID=634770 RepID=A0ABW0N216_9ACTN